MLSSFYNRFQKIDLTRPVIPKSHFSVKNRPKSTHLGIHSRPSFRNHFSNRFGQLHSHAKSNCHVKSNCHDRGKKKNGWDTFGGLPPLYFTFLRFSFGYFEEFSTTVSSSLSANLRENWRNENWRNVLELGTLVGTSCLEEG